MTAEELTHEIFELLYAKHVEGNDDPALFVGLQGDAVVVMQKGGAHLGVRVMPATATVHA